MIERIIEKTADGSDTLFVPLLNEHYHSIKGARTESQHVFVDMGMKQSMAVAPQILEIGFGTGLNAFLTLLAAEKLYKQTHYTSIELYPLSWKTIAKLEYSDSPLFRSLHDAIWNTEIAVTPLFILYKIKEDFTKYTFSGTYDLIYFDAFSPEKQPDMWSQQLFEYLYRIMNPFGILTTYCAKGVIRRMLQDVGFTVERIPGPSGGKREILRARKRISL
ncbi:tRNA 5-methylaminomethyl-2-thiouridine biosynthesis bifunctional protein MnmC [termite gut metagenome]|uniref:tRNA 5-methylaminomethyl-2-thiouridine biosynthesis bifunctional protein MnmC n=1 Tax=termite gut metagenome TaxID=433724 RepID=A0A5J4SYR1_9ZZZZ